MPSRVLQIVPRLPGTLDGVGDNALNLAKALLAGPNLGTRFLVAHRSTATAKDGFEVTSGLDETLVDAFARECDHVILHYVNYGYQARGVPFSLRRFTRKLRGKIRGRWLTAFHELYASGPPWGSAFWLRPLQVKIARDLIAISDACFVSNQTIEREIHAYDAAKKIYLAPIMSNFGEPEIADFSSASPKQWAICGGTVLVARSLISFRRMRAAIPTTFSPARLHIIGGSDEAATRALIDELTHDDAGLSCSYHPEVSADHASELLRQCSFAWLDYFGSGRMWPGMILKSSAFAACCAHGVIPILSHREESIEVEGDALPGPFYLSPGGAHFPQRAEVPELRRRYYDWYRAHASSPQIARVYAEALQ